MALRRLVVDLTQLAAALDAPVGGPTRAFLDRVTGEIEFVPRAVEVGDFDDLFADPKRWVEIAPASKFARLRLRARFAEGVDDVLARPALVAALEGPQPLATFERALRRAPEIRDAWLRFRDRELGREGRRLLAEGFGIEAI